MSLAAKKQPTVTLVYSTVMRKEINMSLTAKKQPTVTLVYSTVMRKEINMSLAAKKQPHVENKSRDNRQSCSWAVRQ